MSKPEDGFAAVVALAWGLTKDALVSGAGQEAGSSQQQAHTYDSSTPGPSSTALLEAAGRARALGTLSSIMGSVAFQLEPEEEHRWGHDALVLWASWWACRARCACTCRARMWQVVAVLAWCRSPGSRLTFRCFMPSSD